MRVVIVDDESLARDELRYLLSSFTDVDIVGEAENIDRAQALIAELKPDLLFLDINMPEGDGFELLQRLAVTPPVVFTTAYDQYAIKAFEVNALDYLLKPIDERSLAKAIDIARQQLPDTQQKMIAPSGPLAQTEKVFLKDRDKCWLVALEDIVLLESIGNYSKVFFAAEQPMIKRSLSQLEERLPANKFVRANRQQIVNIDFVQSMAPMDGGQLLLLMSNGAEVEMSRRQSQQFKDLKSL